MNRNGAWSISPWLITLTFCAVALALRGQIANDAFWLDEIWSYYLSQLMESSWDAFSELRIDNNHLLNTLLLYWSGEQANWSLYRMPAILSGVATVAMMGTAARQLDTRPWLAMLLGTIALPLIQYSAEARGYSSAALFGLMTWYAWQTHLAHRLTTGWLLIFWTSCILGMLSHLTFIFVLAALGIALLWNVVLSGPQWPVRLREAAIAFGIPVAFTGWIYFYFYGRMSAGGEAPDWKLLPNLLELARVTVGAPSGSAITIAAGLLLAALLVIGIFSLPAVQRRFFLLVTCIVPGLLLTLYQPDYFYPRYLLVCLPFVYLVVARALSQALDNNAAIRLLAIGIIAAISAGSALQYAELARLGKGDYPQGVADLFAATDADTFTVGSDFDFRNKALLDFYTRYRSDAKRMTYMEKSWESAQPVDFFFAHNLQPGHKPAHDITLKSGNYRLLKEYPFAGLSGWNWYLYKHENLQPDAANTRP
jgi:hypothetical protein